MTHQRNDWRHRLIALIIGVLLIWGGLSLGLWYTPLIISFLWALLIPQWWWQYLGGVLIAWIGTALPLLTLSGRSQLGPAANVVATVMGFPHQGDIVWVLTFLYAALLGLAGSWVGHAVRVSWFPPQRSRPKLMIPPYHR